MYPKMCQKVFLYDVLLHLKNNIHQELKLKWKTTFSSHMKLYKGDSYIKEWPRLDIIQAISDQ